MRDSRKGLGNTTAQKKQQFFILSNWLSLHSSIVNATPVTSFPTGPLSCYSMWYMHSYAMWMCVGVCVYVCRYLTHVYSLLAWYWAFFLDRSELIWEWQQATVLSCSWASAFVSFRFVKRIRVPLSCQPPFTFLSLVLRDMSFKPPKTSVALYVTPKTAT